MDQDKDQLTQQGGNEPPPDFSFADDPGYLASLDSEASGSSYQNETAYASAEEEESPQLRVIGASPIEPGGDHTYSKNLRDETVHKIFKDLEKIPRGESIEDWVTEIGVDAFLANHLKDFDPENLPEITLPDAQPEGARERFLSETARILQENEGMPVDELAATLGLTKEETASVKSMMAQVQAADEPSPFEMGDVIDLIDTDGSPLQADSSPLPPLNFDSITPSDLMSDREGNYRLGLDRSIATDAFGVPLDAPGYTAQMAKFKEGIAALRTYQSLLEGSNVELMALQSRPDAMAALKLLQDGAPLDEFGCPPGYAPPCAAPEYLDHAKKVAQKRLEVSPRSFAFEIDSETDTSPVALLAQHYSSSYASNSIFEASVLKDEDANSLAPQAPVAADVTQAQNSASAQQSSAPNSGQYDYDGQVYGFTNQYQVADPESRLQGKFASIFDEFTRAASSGPIPSDDAGSMLFHTAINCAWSTLMQAAPGGANLYNQSTKSGLASTHKSLETAKAPSSVFATFLKESERLRLTDSHKKSLDHVNAAFTAALTKAANENKALQQKVQGQSSNAPPTIGNFIVNGLMKLPATLSGLRGKEVGSTAIDLNARRASIIGSTVEQMQAVGQEIKSNAGSWSTDQRMDSAYKLDKLSKTLAPLLDGYRRNGGKTELLKKRDGKPINLVDFGKEMSESVGSLTSSETDKDKKSILENIQESIKLMNESIQRLIESIKSLLKVSAAKPRTAR